MLLSCTHISDTLLSVYVIFFMQGLGLLYRRTRIDGSLLLFKSLCYVLYAQLGLSGGEPIFTVNYSCSKFILHLLIPKGLCLTWERQCWHEQEACSDRCTISLSISARTLSRESGFTGTLKEAVLAKAEAPL